MTAPFEPHLGDRIDDLPMFAAFDGAPAAPQPAPGLPRPHPPGRRQILDMLDWQARQITGARKGDAAGRFDELTPQKAAIARGRTRARITDLLWRSRLAEGPPAFRDGCRACGAPAPGRLMGWWGEQGVAHCGGLECITELTFGAFVTTADILIDAARTAA